VYTSKEQSPLNVTDETSALYNFLYGMSFTYEQFLTLIELSQPNHTKEGSPYSLIRVENENVALDPEPSLPVKAQKKLIREAFYMYSHKGLKSGLETYVESLTGYAPNVTVSPNLLLSVQDSTFYQTTGNWVFGNATVTASKEQVPAIGDKVIDGMYSCKLVASNGFSMILGEDSPITKGIPVTGGVEYTASCKAKSPTSAGSVFITIAWFDGTGTYIDSTATSTTSANNTWKTLSKTATAPSNAVYAAIDISSNAAGTYYIDQVCMQEGNTVAYDEARAITIELSPNNINYIKNPSFEVDYTDWSLHNATFQQSTDIPTEGYPSTYSGKFTTTTGWTIQSLSKIPVVPGQYFCFSMYSKSSNIPNMRMTLDIYDADDNQLESITDEHMISNVWMRNYISGLIDPTSNASYAYLTLSSATGGVVYMDMMLAQNGYAPSDYFDGSMPSEYGNIWQGTAHNSYSLAYYNKPLKLPRLSETVKDWLPQNTFWRIKTLAGLEYTNPTV
jgi:hypothetical protein